MDLKSVFSFRDSEDDAKPFLDHLSDLRVMLIRMAAVLVVAMVGAFFSVGSLRPSSRGPWLPWILPGLPLYSRWESPTP